MALGASCACSDVKCNFRLPFNRGLHFGIRLSENGAQLDALAGALLEHEAAERDASLILLNRSQAPVPLTNGNGGRAIASANLFCTS
jgi:hypothetical protein